MTPDGIERDVLDLLQRWAAAEQDNDPDLLAEVPAPRGPLDARKRPHRPTPEPGGPALRTRAVKSRESS